MAQSGSRTVIVCHFPLFTILGSRKHPRITKNHKSFGDFHQKPGGFHLKIHKNLHFGVDFRFHFTNSGVLFGGKIRWLEVVLVQ